MVKANFIAAATLVASILGGCGSTKEEPPKPDARPDAYVKVPLTFDLLLEACVRLSACGIERRHVLVECANNFYNRSVKYGQKDLYERLFDCANKGQADCKIIRECLGFAGKPKECKKGYLPECRGDVAFNCDVLSGWEQGMDCAKGGLKCAVMDTGEANQSTAAMCGGGPCDKAEFKPVCKSRKLYKCSGGAVEVNDCPAQELQCRDPMVGECEGIGRSCQVATDRCEKNTLARCVKGYRQESDCGKLPGRKKCDPTTNTCVGTGNECSSDADFDKCDGDKLVVCVDGYKHVYDCLEMGFLACEPAKTYGAYCKAAPVYE